MIYFKRKTKCTNLPGLLWIVSLLLLLISFAAPGAKWLNYRPVWKLFKQSMKRWRRRKKKIHNDLSKFQERIWSHFDDIYYSGKGLGEQVRVITHRWRKHVASLWVAVLIRLVQAFINNSYRTSQIALHPLKSLFLNLQHGNWIEKNNLPKVSWLTPIYCRKHFMNCSKKNWTFRKVFSLLHLV